jgi:hypothetical protein
LPIPHAWLETPLPPSDNPELADELEQKIKAYIKANEA